MAIPVDAAAAALRDAMRETVKRYSLWYLIQGVLLVIAGVLAIISPVIASVALVFLLGWILIVSGVLQAIGLIGASHVPHFWLQLISAVLAALIGVLLLRSPESSLLVMTMLLIVYFMVEGLAKVIFALTIRPFPQLGLGFGQRISWDRLVVIALDQHAAERRVAAWLHAGAASHFGGLRLPISPGTSARRRR